ncbi:MAG TPA: hypothetical protein VFI91_13285 [Longimicrobiaceae bacterium]|nr:hypothetical protein [Longimicrobiaceae bacterium]
MLISVLDPGASAGGASGSTTTIGMLAKHASAAGAATDASAWIAGASELGDALAGLGAMSAIIISGSASSARLK